MDIWPSECELAIAFDTVCSCSIQCIQHFYCVVVLCMRFSYGIVVIVVNCLAEWGGWLYKSFTCDSL